MDLHPFDPEKLDLPRIKMWRIVSSLLFYGCFVAVALVAVASINLPLAALVVLFLIGSLACYGNIRLAREQVRREHRHHARH